MQIVTNTTAITLGNQLEVNSRELNGRMSNLSSGKRLQSAADDSANLQISNRLNKLGRGMQVAIRNAHDGISTLQTAEGGLQEVTNVLQRMRELAIQAANASNREDDKRSLNQEYTMLKQELQRVAEQTSFGGQLLLNGSLGQQSYQVGAESNEIIEASFMSVTPKDLKLSKRDLDGQAMAGIYTGADLATARANNSTNGFGNGSAGPASEQITIDAITLQTVQVSSGDSAEKMAEKINQVFNSTGIKAEAKNNVQLHVHDGTATNRTAFDTGEQVSFVLGNGHESETIAFTASGDYQTDMKKLRDKINEASSQTDISAQFDDDRQALILESESGVNIEVSDFSEATATTDNQLSLTSLDMEKNVVNTTTLDNDGSAVVLRGVISLTSPNGESFKISSDLDFGTINSTAGSADSLIQSQTLNIGETSLIDYDSAQSAIESVDASIAMVDRSRASMGAVMNRLTSTVYNLSNVHENTEDAKGQLVDADYSREAAELAKMQVVQQATTALLSQANSMGEQAIRLLG